MSTFMEKKTDREVLDDIIEYFRQDFSSAASWFFVESQCPKIAERLEQLKRILDSHNATLARAAEILSGMRPYVAAHVSATCLDDFSGIGDRVALDRADDFLGSIPESVKAILDILAAARAYDAAISEMEHEHKRDDLYFTQHSTLLPLRQAIRRLGGES